MSSFSVRAFTAADVAALRRLMLALAEFEEYADQFAVTESDLVIHGLGPEPRFRAFVADGGHRDLLGMAVCYAVPWTYDMKPTLVLKELFVARTARGQGIGHALFAAVVTEGRRLGASRLKWTVLPENTLAQAFYRSEGGRPDSKWQPWTLNLANESRHESIL